MLGILLSKTICNVFGLLYPGYQTYKALKTDDVDLVKQTVLSAFLAAEYYTDIFISWLPMYYEVKTGFILWLLYPECRGTKILFDTYVAPLLEKHEEDIDMKIEEAKKKTMEKTKVVAQRGVTIAREKGMEYLGAVQKFMAKGIEDTEGSQDVGSGSESTGLRQRQTRPTM